MSAAFLFAFLQGILFGLGLFVAIGPKDIFAIRYCLSGRHVPGIIILCVGADALLILIGVKVFTWLGSYQEVLLRPVIWAGAIHLCWMGARGAWKLWSANRAPLPGLARIHSGSWRQVVYEGIGVALFNPYAWLDTVFVIGPMAAHKSDRYREAFASGAICASLLWFLFLAFGVSLLRPLFGRNMSWQIFDGLTALLLFILAGQLVFFS